MTTDPKKTKIIIADDHAVVREGLLQIISQETDMTVVEQADDGMKLLDKIRTLDPDLDIVLLDLDMPEKNGWDVMRQLKVEFPNLRIIILSASAEEDYAKLCFKEGASGYLDKVSSLELVVKAIRKVAKGEKFISTELAETIAINEIVCDGKQPHETLSPREFQVFCLIASGKSVNEIAGELSLSAATISTYRARILEKMDLKSNAELIRYAFQHGILK
ncbi:MAG: response regulator transcription factor [Nitrospinaceae bacterium]